MSRTHCEGRVGLRKQPSKMAMFIALCVWCWLSVPALAQGQNIFNNNIFRSKWNYQFTPRLSLLMIGQYSNVLPDPSLSSLEYSKSLAGDVLLTYLLHPGTALCVGYSNLLENYDRQAFSDAALLDSARSGLLSTAARAFVKFSYLYQF